VSNQDRPVKLNRQGSCHIVQLAHLCFGVLKTGKPFDPDHATSTEETAATT
jgi:hypothetical protein